MAGPPKRGGFKKASFAAPKRSAPSSSAPPPKKAKQSDSGDEDDVDAGPVVPVVQTDESGDVYVAINHSGKRRVTVSAFKSSTLVGVREYYAVDGVMKPGKKGISLTVEQYNAFLSAAPLLERELVKRGEKVVRPVYDSVEGSGEVDEEDDEAEVKSEQVEEGGDDDEEE